MHAMPLQAAAMPCSRMPQWMYRPDMSSGVISLVAATFVLFDAVRSAEPVTSSGKAGAMTLSAASPALRVAISGACSASLRL